MRGLKTGYGVHDPRKSTWGYNYLTHQTATTIPKRSLFKIVLPRLIDSWARRYNVRRSPTRDDSGRDQENARCRAHHLFNVGVQAKAAKKDAYTATLWTRVDRRWSNRQLSFLAVTSSGAAPPNKAQPYKPLERFDRRRAQRTNARNKVKVKAQVRCLSAPGD